MKAKRAAFDRWEVLNLSRVWLDPVVQPGGELYGPEHLPGFVDRKGKWRSSLASTVIHDALAKIGCDYLLAHPPCFVSEPYAIRAMLSYCNTHLHRGVIYKASGFELARTNKDGIGNPPYGKQTGLWLGKMAAHNHGIALVFARTETRMFFEHVWPHASALLFLRGRLTFCYPDGRGSKAGHNSGGPSCLIGYGPKAQQRLKAVSDLGAVVTLIQGGSRKSA